MGHFQAAGLGVAVSFREKATLSPGTRCPRAPGVLLNLRTGVPQNDCRRQGSKGKGQG